MENSNSINTPVYIDIRPCAVQDYPALVEIHNTVYPTIPWTVEALLESDRMKPAQCKLLRVLAKRGETPLGYGRYIQYVEDIDVHRFQTSIVVLPAFQRQGVGEALYTRLMDDLQANGARILRADCYSNMPEGIRFAEKRGFKEVFRETPMHLALADFDPAPFAGLAQKLSSQGIEIKSLRELQDDPQRDRKVYAVFCEVWKDVPQEGEPISLPFEDWVHTDLDYPGALDSFFVAVSLVNYIGISEFGWTPNSRILQAGLAGVLPAYRGLGAALGLQVRAIEYARQNGGERITSSTAITNIPMRTLYERLGYLRQPDWLQMEKRITDTNL